MSYRPYREDKFNERSMLCSDEERFVHHRPQRIEVVYQPGGICRGQRDIDHARSPQRKSPRCAESWPLRDETASFDGRGADVERDYGAAISTYARRLCS